MATPAHSCRSRHVLRPNPRKVSGSTPSRRALLPLKLLPSPGQGSTSHIINPEVPIRRAFNPRARSRK